MELGRNSEGDRTGIPVVADSLCDESSAGRLPRTTRRFSWFRSVRSDRGASALEFGLVIPVLLFLLFGIVEFGVIFQHQLALTHAAREGSRMAAVGTWNEQSVKDAAFPIVPTVTVTPNPPTSADRGEPVTVLVTYVHDWLLLPFPGTIQLRGQAVMRRE